MIDRATATELEKKRAWVRQLLAHTPDPPRSVAAADIARHVERRRSLLLVLLAGVFFACFVITSSQLSGPGGIVISAICLLAVAFMLASPPLIFLELQRAARVGLRAHARVLEVDLETSWGGHVSNEPWESVSAYGTWEVADGSRRFREEFELVAPWTRDLRVGSEVVVVVDPREERVLLEVGPQRVTGSTVGAS